LCGPIQNDGLTRINKDVDARRRHPYEFIRFVLFVPFRGHSSWHLCVILIFNR
jgi:hypothetical protein